MIRKHTNRFTNPRLLAAMDDPRVTGIEEAVRRRVVVEIHTQEQRRSRQAVSQ